ncbi:transcobalamin-2 [Lepisosteus oculatus]|uniref:transcobalamin-2 n=1 Tax=Lepisosteus oculatus TaxID=7918 RepID=UPI0035F52D5F
MHFLFFIVFGVFAFVRGKPCDVPTGNEELVLSLNKKLLRSAVEETQQLNPSVHLGLRLSRMHNLAIEKDYLAKLKKELQSSFKSSVPSTGLLALHALALRASCEDATSPSVLSTTLEHLRHQLHREKENIHNSRRPLTNYYQYGLGVLALCVNGVQVNPHVINKLIQAQSDGSFLHGDTVSIDTVSMAALAFQCLLGSPKPCSSCRLEQALLAAKDQILNSSTEDGLLGNAFSTPLALQALRAMGARPALCSSAMAALVTEMGRGTFHNPMALSQLLPALHHRTYLDVRSMACQEEDDILVLDPKPPQGDPSPEMVPMWLTVEIPGAHSNVYSMTVPKGSSLLYALKKLYKEKPQEFSFKTETSLWGPFLSVINGHRASQAEREYWQLLKSPDTPLVEGIRDYKVQEEAHIVIRKTSW